MRLVTLTRNEVALEYVNKFEDKKKEDMQRQNDTTPRTSDLPRSEFADFIQDSICAMLTEEHLCKQELT